MKERAVFAFDIDQTLAGGVVSAHMRHYNQRFSLDMTEEQIEAADGYAKTFDHPLIQSFREQNRHLLGEWPTVPATIGTYSREQAEQLFQRARAEIRTSALVHMALKTLPGSIDAVQRIVDSTRLNGMNRFGGYYSVRPDTLTDTTIHWLTENKALSPEKVVICEDPRDKIEKLFEDWSTPDEDGDLPAIVVIDDSHKNLAEASEKIVSEDPDMKKHVERLIVVGYGDRNLKGTFYPITGLRALSLPTYDEVDLKLLERELAEKTGIRL